LYVPTNEGGKFLDVRFEHSDLLWPWSGFLALYVYVRSEGSAFNGTATGEATFTIVSPPMPGETEDRRSTVKLPITVAVIPVPPRCI
jgi:membrane-bound transcription factor site-1 protease